MVTERAQRGKRSEEERERGARKERSKREETRTVGEEGETYGGKEGWERGG